MKNQKVLISGASIAGLTTAWWLNYVGYNVTIVEMASVPRIDGAAINLDASSVQIAKRMGLYEQLKAHQLGVDRIAYKNAADETEGTIIISPLSEVPDDEIEIERDKFIEIIMASLTNKVAFIFSDSITGLKEDIGKMNVTFKNSNPAAFNLVFGCDGSHSGTRKVWFGPEQDYARFLGAYFSISIVPKLLIPQRTMQTFSVPFKSMMLNAYNGKTDIIFIFLSETEIPYNYRDEAQQRKIIAEQFSGEDWRTTELLEEVQRSPGFYFDKFCQIDMPSWSKGRVALIGDAAYCPSAAAGQGGSLAIQGAAAVAEALVKHQGNYREAFDEYELGLRPAVEEIQAIARKNLKTQIVLTTEEAIRRRNAEAKLF